MDYIKLMKKEEYGSNVSVGRNNPGLIYVIANRDGEEVRRWPRKGYGHIHRPQSSAWRTSRSHSCLTMCLRRESHKIAPVLSSGACRVIWKYSVSFTLLRRLKKHLHRCKCLLREVYFQFFFICSKTFSSSTYTDNLFVETDSGRLATILKST